MIAELFELQLEPFRSNAIVTEELSGQRMVRQAWLPIIWQSVSVVT